MGRPGWAGGSLPQPSPRPPPHPQASGKKIKVELTGRRAGDTVAVWAATGTAERELGWTAKLDIDRMCVDQWRWASMNPKGYEE